MRHTVIAALALLAIATPAHAEIKIAFEKGVWSLGAGTNDFNESVCIALTSGTDTATGAGFSFSIRQFGANVPQVWIIQDTWEIPAGTKAPMTIEFDQKGKWDFPMGSHPNDTDVLWGELSRESADLFIEEMMTSDNVLLTFLQGNEPPWRLSLDGSAAVLLKYSECTGYLRQTAPPTQPFSAPTQPFAPSAKPATPTQPFTPAVFNY